MIIASASVVAAIAMVGCGFFVYNSVQKNKSDAEDAEVTARINECVTATKKNMLGFVSECYEKEGREAPADVLQKDKERVDRIIAQADYDNCMANAKLNYYALWDLNDDDPQNGDIKDPIRYYISGSIQKEYEQDVEECKTSYPLIGSYEKGFKTEYTKELIGWTTPKSDKVPIINRYNASGLIIEGSNMPANKDVPDTVASVGFLVASKFKNSHLDLWY